MIIQQPASNHLEIFANASFEMQNRKTIKT